MSSDLAVVCVPHLEGALAAGLVIGAASGGMLEAKEAERLDGELFRDLRERVPKGESAWCYRRKQVTSTR